MKHSGPGNIGNADGTGSAGSEGGFASGPDAGSGQGKSGAGAMHITTVVRCRLRSVADASAARLFTGPPLQAHSLREELFASSRQPELALRFLAQLDQKLDEVLARQRSEELEKDFPLAGHVVELGLEACAFESDAELCPGEHAEILFMLEAQSFRIIPVIACITACAAASSFPGRYSRRYSARYVAGEALASPASPPSALPEEERDALIRFLFSEERKRIRRLKGSGE